MSPGRPKLPPEEKRSEYVGIRVSPAELTRLYAVSRVMRMDVSEFIRLMAVPDHVTVFQTLYPVSRRSRESWIRVEGLTHTGSNPSDAEKL